MKRIISVAMAAALMVGTATQALAWTWLPKNETMTASNGTSVRQVTQAFENSIQLSLPLSDFYGSLTLMDHNVVDPYSNDTLTPNYLEDRGPGDSFGAQGIKQYRYNFASPGPADSSGNLPTSARIEDYKIVNKITYPQKSKIKSVEYVEDDTYTNGPAIVVTLDGFAESGKIMQGKIELVPKSQISGATRDTFTYHFNEYNIVTSASGSIVTNNENAEKFMTLESGNSEDRLRYEKAIGQSIFAIG